MTRYSLVPILVSIAILASIPFQVVAEPAKVFGVYKGAVTNAKDPLERGRVQVTVPAIVGGEKLWMERVFPTRDAKQQKLWAAQAGDEVLVAFESGDLAHPYVIGFLWNGSKKPPE